MININHHIKTIEFNIEIEKLISEIHELYRPLFERYILNLNCEFKLIVYYYYQKFSNCMNNRNLYISLKINCGSAVYNLISISNLNFIIQVEIIGTTITE